jgi:DNA repair protein RecN (Recombination protein N)
VLCELAVRDLGVIAELRLGFGPGMTALTGETGAGKTLLVEALELLLGGRADGTLVRPGADAAVVEARFEHGGEERFLAREVPANGRSRAFVDGRMAPVSVLSELGAELVDLHGQHAHQSLLSPAVQRRTLDAFGGIDTGPRKAATARVGAARARLQQLGGDARARAREIELLRHELGELDGAAIEGPDEDERLAEEEERLAGAGARREAALAAVAALEGEDALGRALSALAGASGWGRGEPLAAAAERLRGLQAELADLTSELRRSAEGLEDDPERLAAVQGRRRRLRDLCRKYGDTLGEVLAYADRARARLAELEAVEAEGEALERELAAAERELAAADVALLEARRAAAPRLERLVEAHLERLALPRARFAVEVGPGCDDVVFLLGPNPGEPPLPLARAASGGELARAMLALELVRAGAGGEVEGPPTLVFDEVDAGIGGEAALAVGRALADVSESRQVLVVTHLPQVAAFADHQVRVEKRPQAGRTVASATVLDDEARVVELSRMLSGHPHSPRAREHALELLEGARASRGGRRGASAAPIRGRRRGSG